MTERASGSYREAVRIEERLIDFQVREYEHHQRIAGEFMRVAMASLAGMLAVIGLLSTAGYHPVRSLYWSAVAAVALVVGGLAILLVSYGGMRNRWLEVGPEAGRVARAVRDAPHDGRSLLVSLAETLDANFEHNRSVLTALARWRFVALSCNISGVALFLATLAYISGGPILA